MLDKEFFAEFGMKIKIYRLKKGLTQAELDEKIDMSEHRLSEIERGKCNITLKSVNKIANALEIDVFKLFNFSD